MKRWFEPLSTTVTAPLGGGSLVRCRMPVLSWAAALSFGVLGCDGDPRLPAASAPSASVATSSGAVPERPEAVARADALAMEGARMGGATGAALLARAADLRERLWRVERRHLDALEALELYEQAERADPAQACPMGLRRALLRGEAEGEPAAAYREAYLARGRAPRTACARDVDKVLATLAAYKPLPSVLAELDTRVDADAGAKGPRAEASVRLDERGPVVVPTLEPHAADGPLRIANIERYGAKDAARIVVTLTRPTTFDVGFLEQHGALDARLFVDVHGARYRGKSQYDVGGLVKRVRLGQKKEFTRVVLDLERQVYRKIFYLPEPFRLVIDVSSEPPQERQGLGLPSGPRTIRRVVLDPGHGGHDPGAVGPGGLREKDVTLDVAHRAAPLIARELNVSTLLTRDSDDFVSLPERTARANAFQADLFVSIHCNASEDGQGRGVMSFVLDTSADMVAANIAAQENAASPAAGAELANALKQVVDPSSVARSTHFAELLQRATMASLLQGYRDVPDRGVRRAGFYVLAGARMPAVLFEASFISDPNGELYLNTGEYRQKLADAIVNAVRAYRDGH